MVYTIKYIFLNKCKGIREIMFERFFGVYGGFMCMTVFY